MTATVRATRRSRLVVAAMTLAVVALAAPSGSFLTLAATPVDAGFRDFVYGPATGADDVSAPPMQSKLWFHDGHWFGILFDQPTDKFRIYTLDMATQDWTATSAFADDRNRTNADALSDGNSLYVVSSSPFQVDATTRDVRVYRYTYSTTTDTYTVSSGFPKTLSGTGAGTGAATIARDSDGDLWVAFPQAGRVKFSTSTDDGVTWSLPADVPGMGDDVASDDVAAIASLGATGEEAVGIFWSNQSLGDDAFYFAAHLDSDPTATWQARETAMGEPGTQTFTADNHISVKTDSTGRLLAAVKTSRNDGSNNGGDPLIAVLRRVGSPDAAGTWETHTVTTVSVKGTRPMLVLDDESDEANVFLTFPTLASDGDQAIYRRTAPIGSLDFGTPSIGTPFIDAEPENAINDATSTKQITSAASGIIVEAADIPTVTYLHGCAGSVCPQPPTANFTSTPASGNAPLVVQFTDTSTNDPTTWSWSFGDGATSTQQNPSHTYADAGDYTVSLTVTNPSGSDSVTKTDLISVGPPVETTYKPITPERFVDSRSGTGFSGLAQGPFLANVHRTFSVAGKGSVPANAVAVTGNLTVVGQTGAGYLAVGPVATDHPTTSILNFPVSDVRANGITVQLDDAGKLSVVYAAGSGKKTDIVFDVTGYFVEATTEATFKSIEPLRVLDTRPGTGLSGKFNANFPRTFNVAGLGGAGGIAANAIAVTGNLTVVGQTAAGYLALGPVSTSTPPTSTLNFPLSDIRANNVTVPLDANGDLSAVYKAATGAKTDVVFDVTGYFIAGTSGASFVPVTPGRILDTRIALGLPGKLVHLDPSSWDVEGQEGVGTGAVAVVGNATVVGQSKAGYVAITPTEDSTPPTSTINFPLGDIRANGFTVDLSGTGTMSGVYLATTGATTNLVVDVMGYYR